MPTGRIVAISVSENKGEKKKNITEANLLEDEGIQGDAHAQGGIRQVSLLADESITKMKEKGVIVSYGDFAENIVTKSIDLVSLNIRDTINVGNDVILEVSKKGKECTSPCSIYYQVGYCIMPTEGVFCTVKRSGKIRVGDTVHVERLLAE